MFQFLHFLFHFQPISWKNRFLTEKISINVCVCSYGLVLVDFFISFVVYLCKEKVGFLTFMQNLFLKKMEIQDLL